ncbi:MAG: hypothetical protein AAGH78_02120 [Cyanobacteria bacterium P01_H01_bin.58]
MNAQSISQQELYHRLVIDIETAEELGRFSHFKIDVKNHQVEGFVCRSGVLGQDRQPVLWVQIDSIGKDSILVRFSDGLITERFDEALTLDKQEIWSDAGEKVGLLVDYSLDLETGAITQYLFTAPSWQGLTEGIYAFAPAAVVSAGKKRMMVRQAALEAAKQVTPGIPDRLTETWQQDVNQTQQDLQKVVGNTQAVASQVQEQTQKIAEQAKSRFGGVLGEMKRRSRQLRSQVNDRVADVTANLQDKAQPGSKNIPGTTIDVDSEPVWGEDEVPSPSTEDKL